MRNPTEKISLEICDRRVNVYCESVEAAALLSSNYGQMQSHWASADLNYTIGKHVASGEFYITRGNRKFQRTKFDGEFLYLFEQDISIELQTLRDDLFFVHSAALEFAGKACLLVGPSKSGKSTTTLALLYEGFRYLSDEIAPVNPKTLHVYPYPRALWLRRESPSMQLPSCKIETSRMVCIPTGAFPNGASENQTPLAAVFFVRHCSEAARPSIRIMPKPRAAAQLLAGALNPGAHSGNGLDAAIEIAERIVCHELITADLTETCAIIKDTLVESV